MSRLLDLPIDGTFGHESSYQIHLSLAACSELSERFSPSLSVKQLAVYSPLSHLIRQGQCGALPFILHARCAFVGGSCLVPRRLVR